VLSSSSTGVEIGTQIMGTFEIVEHIASGGMGEVYRGLNIHTKEPVAIKIVLAALAHDEKILSMFQKEATVLGRLHHDAIVRYQLFTIDPNIRRACLVMEFVEGRALSDHLAERPVALADVVAMAKAYSEWMATNEIPKLFIDAKPGSILTGELRDFCMGWKNQTVAEAKGYHFLQEDSPDEIGEAISGWLKTL